MLIPFIYFIGTFQLAFEKNFYIFFSIVLNIWPVKRNYYFKAMNQSPLKAKTYHLSQASAV